MNQKVVIIGGGIIGCLTAIELVKKSVEVLVVEKSSIGNEASKAAGGVLFPLMPWNYESFVYGLCKNSSKYYRELEKILFDNTNIDIELINSGIQILPPFNNDEIVNWCKNNFIEAEKSSFNNHKTLLIKDIFQVNPPKLMRALKIYLKKIGVDILEKSEVINFEQNYNKVIACDVKDFGKVYGDKFIIASGAWSSQINEKLSKFVYPVRGQVIQYEKSDIKLKHIIFRDGTYILQRKDNSIVVGSTLENVGFSKENVEESINFLNSRAISMIHELKGLKIEKHWFGFRPGTEKNKPIVKVDDFFDNLFLNTGHHRYGITMAPHTATSLVDYVTC